MALQPSATDSLATDDHTTIGLSEEKNCGELGSDMSPNSHGKCSQ